MHNTLQTALFFGGVGQLALVAASLAIPRVLRWREDTARLRPLTRQVFWTYAGYIWVTNLCFGLLAALAPGWLLDGSHLAAVVSGYTAAYWGARITIQFTCLDRAGALVPGVADRRQEERLHHPRRRSLDEVGAGDEQLVVGRRAGRELPRPREVLRRPVLHRPEETAVVVVVERAPRAPLVFDLLETDELTRELHRRLLESEISMEVPVLKQRLGPGLQWPA